MTELLNEFLSGSVAWGVLLTLAAFALGFLINKVTGKAFFNPLLLGAIFVIILLSVLNIPYADYKVSAAPVNYLTTAISMDVAAELGGIAALTGAIVILTGIAGSLLAESVCKWFHITDPIAKGVGIGTSAHAVGTSKALQMGEVEGAMSGLSIAVAGVLTAVLCPIFVGFIQ